VTPNRLLLGLVATCGLVGVAVAGVWAAQEFSIGRGESSTVAAAPTDTGSGSDSVVPETVELESAEPEPEPEREPGPVDPEILAAHQDGSMVDLGGLFFDNAGTDPFAWRPNPQSCLGLERGVIVDREVQRGWFCSDEQVGDHFVLTSSDLQPDPGEYAVYAKDIQAWSWEFGPPSTMTHFVAFTRGKFQGARIAFHSVPKYSDGSWAQPLDSVGTLEHYGDSSGCIRLLPEDAVALWDFLDLGGTVRVVS
jgi:hypothetical protein